MWGKAPFNVVRHYASNPSPLFSISNRDIADVFTWKIDSTWMVPHTRWDCLRNFSTAGLYEPRFFKSTTRLNARLADPPKVRRRPDNGLLTKRCRGTRGKWQRGLDENRTKESKRETERMREFWRRESSHGLLRRLRRKGLQHNGALITPISR